MTMTRSSIRLALVLSLAAATPVAAQQWLAAPGAKTRTKVRTSTGTPATKTQSTKPRAAAKTPVTKRPPR